MRWCPPCPPCSRSSSTAHTGSTDARTTRSARRSTPALRVPPRHDLGGEGALRLSRAVSARPSFARAPPCASPTSIRKCEYHCPVQVSGLAGYEPMVGEEAPALLAELEHEEPMEVVDVFAQHPTPRFIADPIFASLRRWTKMPDPDPNVAIPVDATLRAMEAGGVSQCLVAAWYAPRNVMISNDEVASFVDASGGRLVGVGSVDISRPMEAVAEIRRCVNELGFKAIRVLPWLWRRRPPTGASIPYMWRAPTSASHSAPRSGTRGPSCRRRSAARCTSTRSPSTFPS